MYTGLMHSHSSLGYLLMLVSTVSLLLAVVTLATGAKPGLLKVASVLRIVETSLMGLIGLLGIGMWAMNWPLGAWWAWAGLIVVVASSVVLARGVKPALNGLKAGEDGLAGRWLASAGTQWLLVLGGIAVMHMK